MHPALFLIYFTSAAVILLACLSLMVQFSLPYFRAGSAGVLLSFVLVSFKVFCDRTNVLIMSVFLKLVIKLSVSDYFSPDIKFPK